MTKQLTLADASIDISSPKALAEFANTLKQFIVDNDLYTEIQGKNFVHVEGWQFAGASMGLFPILERYENVSPADKDISFKTKYGNQTASVYKYNAEVKIVRLSTGETVGYGVALCSNEEKKKNTFDEYAVLSMAQTRAVGKAFRLSLGWIMKLAGYETTTAEEMEEVDEPSAAMPQLSPEDVKMLVDIQLIRMEAAEKIKFLKEYVGTISDKKLTDEQYRVLLAEIQRRRENEPTSA